MASSQTGFEGRVLYGTEQFQVRLWHVPPGRHPVAALPDESEYFLLRGPLRLLNTNGEGCAVEAGVPLALQNQPGTWENPSESAAELLELRWLAAGSPRVDQPLGEVTEVRPWGSFTVLQDQPHYKLKQLLVNPGGRLSLQRHQHREEHWLITRGEAEITLNESISRYGARQYVHIPLRAWHRIKNPGPQPVEFIELQLGESFEESDIERREDDYGRA